MSPKSASNGCASDNHEQNSTTDSPQAKNTADQSGNQLPSRQGVSSNQDNVNQFDGGDQNGQRSGSSGSEELGDNEHSKLCGMFYVGIINRDPKRSASAEIAKTYLLCRAFWCGHGLLTTHMDGNYMNVLEVCRCLLMIVVCVNIS